MNEKSIQIDADDYAILKTILQRYQYKFYAYGSRARGDARRYSDIDIYCKDEMSNVDRVNLATDLEESNITIKVDIIDKNMCSQEFLRFIEADLLEIK